jgi:uncharacterized membrane protein YbaN (DUF454 family)
VPGLPTVSFYVLAAAFYARGSEKFYNWLLHHPVFGRYVRDYRAGLGMPFRSKVYTIAMMWTAVTYAVYALTRLGDPGYGQATVLLAGVIGVWFVGLHIPTQHTSREANMRWLLRILGAACAALCVVVAWLAAGPLQLLALVGTAIAAGLAARA